MNYPNSFINNPNPSSFDKFIKHLRSFGLLPETDFTFNVLIEEVSIKEKDQMKVMKECM